MLGLVVGGLTAAVALLYVWHNYFGAGSHGRRRPYLPPRQFKPVVDGGSGREIICKEPASGRLQGILHAFTAEEVNGAIQRAKIAQKEWAKTSLVERAALLQDLLDYTVTHQDELANFATDSGKTRLEALSGEVLTTCEKLRWIIAEGPKYLKPEYRSPPLLLKAVKSARVEYVPFGVVASIVPFNYPLHNVLSAVSSIIYAGNAAVIKVSEHASWSSVPLENLLRRLLAERGHDPELIQIVRGYGETGEALCGSPDIGKILFIGSPEVGALVMKTASRNLTPVILELGGKDAFIVCEDADLDHVVDNAFRGSFFNCGQNCIAAERFYIHERIYDRFVNAVQEKVALLRQGDTFAQTVDMGCMTFSGSIKKLEYLINDAVEKGARLVHGGKLISGNFFAPTVVADCDHSMKLVTEEAFGPIMTIIKFRSDDEVVQMANGTRYGLGLSVYSANYARAEQIVSQIESGMAVINDFGMGYLIQALPFGGVKASGFGKFNGPEGLREFCVLRTIVTDRFGSVAKSPMFLKAPITEQSYQIMKSAVTMIYSVSLTDKLKGLASMLRHLITYPAPKDRLTATPFNGEKVKAA
eukprot:TRINITY_DN4003_c0_g1_i1.p1 TRINITY_DN4003_c0_g1~~TRINITY_DN4003_c0_g1_i1.p1  ORF type:complete len:586 (-),score=158.93 TRINITY_DN4003_c0_g1_i1:120-1877(-)